MLTDKWDEQDGENEQNKQAGDEPHRVEITRALFEFDCTDTPLSWHLSAEDQRYIEKNWQEELTASKDSGEGWEKVRAFLTEAKSAE